MYTYTMDIISSFFIVICGCSGYIGAMIVVRYEKSSPVSISGLISCGVSASAYNYCAARVTNSACYPLERDWCVSKDMSDGGVYIIKKAITERLKDTLVSEYERTIPIYLSQDSELEFKFKLHSGWTEYAIDLKDYSGNYVLHIKCRTTVALIFNTKVDGKWLSEERYYGTFQFTDGPNYTLKIVCATNGFQIYLDGALVWTYLYRLPADTIRFIESYFRGAQCDLFQVTYKAGP